MARGAVRVHAQSWGRNQGRIFACNRYMKRSILSQDGALALQLLEPAINGGDELELAVDLRTATAALAARWHAAAAIPGRGALFGRARLFGAIGGERDHRRARVP